MIKPEEIRLAYRLLLGRDPENEGVVTEFMQTLHSVDELRTQFYSSSEFRERMGLLLEKPQELTYRHPFQYPQIPVQVDCTPEALNKMFERINKQWVELGKNDVYWSVITQPQYHVDDFEQHREYFFNSGKLAVDVFMASLRRCGINPNMLKSCLDFGCGVGRVTSYLAERFSKVVGVDISEPHLALARDYLSSKNIDNVELVHYKNVQMMQDLPQVDAIFTIITLQHNPPPIIFWTIKSLLNLLRPGGVAYFQVPTYKNGYLFEVERYFNTPEDELLEMHFVPQSLVFRAIQEADCVCLEVREDNMIGQENIMLSNSFVVQKN